MVKEHLAAGQHQVEWNGRDHADRRVASGVYWYSLRAGGKSLTRKLVLIR
jgi:flagellar hook assembly protein FlgD